MSLLPPVKEKRNILVSLPTVSNKEAVLSTRAEEGKLPIPELLVTAYATKQAKWWETAWRKRTRRRELPRKKECGYVERRERTANRTTTKGSLLKRRQHLSGGNSLGWGRCWTSSVTLLPCGGRNLRQYWAQLELYLIIRSVSWSTPELQSLNAPNPPFLLQLFYQNSAVDKDIFV